MDQQHDHNQIHKHIKLLGTEVEYCTGVRAAAAARIMNAQQIEDQDQLFEVCEKQIGSSYLFEGYGEADATQTFKLGEGCPFASLGAYTALRGVYGADWLYEALKDYAVQVAASRYNGMPEHMAKKWVLSAYSQLLLAEKRADKGDVYLIDLNPSELRTLVEQRPMFD
jgi:hypothetical protein